VFEKTWIQFIFDFNALILNVLWLMELN